MEETGMITQGEVVDIAREAIYYIILDSAPPLLVSLIVGLIVSVFQTMTSIQEQTLTFVPKIIAVFASIMIFGSWMMTNLNDYITGLWSSFSNYV